MDAVKLPILVRCECGTTTSADAGDEVTCDCGRRYATELTTQQAAALHSIQAQMRVFARLGIGVVGLVTLLVILEFGALPGGVVLAIGIAAWWALLQPVWRRHAVARLAGLPPSIIRPL